jgi:lipoprotein-anchoring transpeptidase ErfK/SrfK
MKRLSIIGIAVLATATFAAGAQAQTIASLLGPQQQYAPQPQAVVPQAYAPQQYAPIEDEIAPDAQIDPRLQRQIVNYRTNEAPGTVIIDTPNTYLYLVMGDGKAIRYGIGVGREGFTWSGVKQVARKAEWPDWYPPQEMIARQPYLPRMTAGGPGNPLGARALYIGGTQYRIHGTNNPATIGHEVSSGCIRLTNEDVIDLYERVKVGAKVVVLPQQHKTAQRKQQLSDSYAPVRETAAPTGTQAWATIRPSGIY